MATLRESAPAYEAHSDAGTISLSGESAAGEEG